MAALLVGAQLQGCAMVVGRKPIADPRTIDPDAAKRLELKKLGSGNLVQVTLRDSTTLVGRYRGVDRMSPEAYQAYLDSTRVVLGDSTPFPAPGTDVLVYFKNSKTKTLRLDSYAAGAMRVRAKDDRDIVPLQFASFEAVSDLRRTLWPSSLLSDLSNEGRLPTPSQINIDLPKEKRAIPLEQVQMVGTRMSGVHMVAGTVFTLATVAFVGLATYVTLLWGKGTVGKT